MGGSVKGIRRGLEDMKKILIIEDEPNIRELILYNLKTNGYDGIAAEDWYYGDHHGASGRAGIEYRRISCSRGKAGMISAKNCEKREIMFRSL